MARATPDDRDFDPTPPVVTRSGRDLSETHASLQSWLTTKLPGDAAPVISDLAGTSANGMSSETLLMLASWNTGGERIDHPMVARLAPRADDVPVFASYDLDVQFSVLGKVRELTAVPVPKVWWYEDDPSVVGSPFFTMEKIDGAIPADVMPYNFGDNWLFDASTTEQRTLQDTTVAMIAELHSIERVDENFPELPAVTSNTTALRAHFARTLAWYEWVAANFSRSPLVDRLIAKLDDQFPSHTTPTVLSWGDSRIGNVIYQDFEPVAALDWEMVGFGPPELDVFWLAYAHEVFEDIAAQFSLPGLPDFLQPDDVATTYESLTGHVCRDAEWFLGYAALRYAIVFLRVGQRAVYFGDQAMPDDIDDLLHNRPGLERRLGTSRS